MSNSATTALKFLINTCEKSQIWRKLRAQHKSLKRAKDRSSQKDQAKILHQRKDTITIIA